MSNTPRTDAIEDALLAAREAGLLIFNTGNARVVAGMILGALADGPYPEAPVIVWTRKPEAAPPEEDADMVYACTDCGVERHAPNLLAVHTRTEHNRLMTPDERKLVPSKKDTAP